jgi:exonuclease SbcC
MRPLTLNLTNFGSYADATIDFSTLRIVGLFGPNGSGKSTTIEALLWTLFGEASRGGRKSLDAYVRTGADECLAELTFELQGRTYKVARSRNAAKGKTILDFTELNADGEWQSRGLKTLADTQEAIEAVLKVNYDTLTASAVSSQGESARFSEMTDADRKAVLGQILNLGQWDGWQADAKARLKSSELERARLEGKQEQLRAVVDQKEGLGRELAEAKQVVSDAQLVLAELSVEVEATKAREAAANTVLEQLSELATSRDAIRAEANGLDARRKELQASIESQQALIDRKESVLRAASELEELKGLLAADEQAAELRAEQEDAIRALRSDQDERQRQLDQSKMQARRLEDQQATLEAVRNKRVARLEAETKALEPQAELQTRVPCAGGPLAERCELLAGALQATARLAEIAATLPRMREPEEEELAAAGEVEAAQSLQESLSAAVMAGAAKLQEAEQLLTPIDRAAITERQRQARELADLAGQLPRIQDAEQRTVVMTRDIEELTAQGWAKSAQVHELEERGLALREQLGESIASVREARIYAEQEALRATRTLGECQVRVGSLQARLEAVAAAEAELSGLSAEATRLADEATTWELVEGACNKIGGVPALIVENAVPELERLTNEFLARVMDGALAVRLDTQVALKSGALGEALRVTVLQNNVERDYSSYSGAEKFLVDLSLRVALSRFLSHRAGGEIGLFVLDEGLGALDAANRQAFCEALEALGQEFSLVLVVTHLEALQDVFTQRLVVSKDENGSRVEVA